jgi:hypothetical protein
VDDLQRYAHAEKGYKSYGHQNPTMPMTVIKILHIVRHRHDQNPAMMESMAPYFPNQKH